VARRDRSARVLARARLWAPLVVVAAVPVSVLAAGGSTPADGSGAALAAVSVPSATSTTTGIGRSLCRIVGTPACTDSPTTSDTGTATDTGADTTTAGGSSALAPPDTGVCSNVKLPGVCATSSRSSTVTVQPPGSVTDTAATTKSTRTAKATTKTKSKSAATTTVTVTVTRSSTASSPTTAAATTTP
jgi:hypothetical protein